MVIAQKTPAIGGSKLLRKQLTRFKPKDPLSAHTHFAGFVLAIIGMPALLVRAALRGAGAADLIGMAVFAFSMILLYGASASYHSFQLSERGNRILKKIDHMSIFVLIAGSYTPMCLSVLNGASGRRLLIAIWMIALVGIIFKAFFVYCPKWVSSMTYTAMGWSALAVFGKLRAAMGPAAFAWLIAEGIFYTAGAVIYALKPRFLRGKSFGGHELFHCFVLAGSFCHYLLVFCYLP